MSKSEAHFIMRSELMWICEVLQQKMNDNGTDCEDIVFTFKDVRFIVKAEKRGE